MRSTLKWVAIGLIGVFGLALALGLVLFVISLAQADAAAGNSGPALTIGEDLALDGSRLEVVDVCFECHHNGGQTTNAGFAELRAIYQALGAEAWTGPDPKIDWVQVYSGSIDPS